MALTPSDMLEIQSAIDEYEKKFPRRATPSAEVALAWRLGKREVARQKLASPFSGQECNRLVWAWEQIRLQWQMWSVSRQPSASVEGLQPWVNRALRLGWWSMVAVVTASVFFFGAIVGGFK
jgi:hypothetical protein